MCCSLSKFARFGIFIATIAATIAFFTGCGKSESEKENDAIAKELAKQDTELREQREDEKRERTKWKKEEADYQKAIERDRQAEAQREQQEDMARQRQQEADDKVRLTKYAEMRFSQISLYPTIRLSRQAQEMGITVQLQGRDLEKYRQLLKAKDWFALYRLHYESDEKYESEMKIDDAAKQVLYNEFAMRIIPRSQIDEPNLTVVHLPKVENEDSSDYSSSNEIRTSRPGEKHPDGRSLLSTWDATSESLLVLVNDTPGIIDDRLSSKIYEIDEQYQKKKVSIKRRYELGEISEQEMNRQLLQSRVEQRDDFLALLEPF